MCKNAPFKFNLAGWASLPISVTMARSFDDQIIALYDLADDPTCPKDKSIGYLTLIQKMKDKQQQ
jgi:hypothetical protein